MCRCHDSEAVATVGGGGFSREGPRASGEGPREVPRPPEGGANLESTGDSVREEGDRLFVVEERCRSRFCRICGPQLGRRLRQRLMLRAAGWENAVLITLTVDRHGTKTGRGFESAKAAYLDVTGKRYVARLLRNLGVHRWVAVLEFTQDGWPHWHVLAADAPWVDYRELRRWWGDVWRVAAVVNVQRKTWASAGHAVNYICKYLTKVPERDFPDWVLDAKTRVRMVSTSRSVGALLGRGVVVEDREKEGLSGEEDGQLPRSHRERRSRCGWACRIVAECVTSEGEVRRASVGRLPYRASEVVSRFKDVCQVERAVWVGGQRVRLNWLASLEDSRRLCHELETVQASGEGLSWLEFLDQLPAAPSSSLGGGGGDRGDTPAVERVARGRGGLEPEGGVPRSVYSATSCVRGAEAWVGRGGKLAGALAGRD